MGLLAWARTVIADRGEHEPVQIHLERAPAGGYAFRLGVRAGFGGQEIARIPVERRANPAPHPILKEIHLCEVAGQTLEAANIYALRGKVARVLEVIAPARALPLCYFRAPALDYELPVYETAGGELSSPVIGAPKLRADDLAGIRRLVCRYLESAGYVNGPEEVTVGVVRPRDLRRVSPAAVFRSQTDPELWIPSVEGSSPDGPVVGVVGQAAELRRPGGRRRAGPQVEDAAPAAPDVLALLRYVAVALAGESPPGLVPRVQRAGSIAAEGLYASEVRPEIWAAAERRTEDAGTRLVAWLADADGTRLELTVRRTGAGDVAAALEDQGITVFLAADEPALAVQVGRHLARGEFLRFAEEVEVHALQAPRAEQLDVDAITSPRAEPEEVHEWS